MPVLTYAGKWENNLQVNGTTCACLKWAQLPVLCMLCCNEREDSLPSCHKLMPGQGPTDGTFKCTALGTPLASLLQRSPTVLKRCPSVK